MKLQDRFKYDPTLVGLEGKYEAVGDDGFLIVSKCIMVADQIITTGQTYFLVERDEQKNPSATFVKLVDCFYFQDMVYLLVVDAVSGVVRLLNHTLENGLTICKWKLVDTFSVEQMLDKKYGSNREPNASNQIPII